LIFFSATRWGDVHACAALAAAQALRVLSPDDTPPPVWIATLEIDSYAAKVRHRWWPRIRDVTAVHADYGKARTTRLRH